MEKVKVTNITGLQDEEIATLCESDYLNIGNKTYISKQRAKLIVKALSENQGTKCTKNQDWRNCVRHSMEKHGCIGCKYNTMPDFK